MLDERKQKILKAIIDDFIITAEPVGSRTIARKYNIGISPATIRNEMSDLEEMGYLEQPHTSAGRIPSDKGYRFYVDFLMKLRKLTPEEIKNIKDVSLYKKINGIEELLEQTTKVLSQITRYTSVALGPQLKKTTLKHLQLVPVENKRVLMVIVTNSGLVEHKLLSLPKNVTESDLERVSNIINDKLSGLAIGDISDDVISNVKKEIIGFSSDVFDMAIEFLLKNLQIYTDSKLFLYGTTNIFNLPEFRDIEKARNFLSILEDKELLCEILSNSFMSKDIVITIGSENKYQEIKNCSVITTTYKINGKTIGSIGVVGPTRMEYSKVVSIVRFLSENMSQLISKILNN
ncbi:MAG: heat-inducible transcriptional repressor [Thermosediminibacterales bacterium]|nr:heat-inducible transcriptional repressor [Thermosediminibacterales bacterium]